MSSLEPKAGRDAIDVQHRAIFAFLSELEQSLAAKDAAGAMAALDRIWDEMVGHFGTEEALMEAHAYPERAAHGSAHHLFLEDLRALIAEQRASGLSDRVLAWAKVRMPEWIQFHVRTNDIPLERFLLRKAAARIVSGALGEPPVKPGSSGA